MNQFRPNLLGLVAFCFFIVLASCSKVIEIDDRLVEFSNQGKWLVSFYAPWCGHCRKLEPVMEEVAKHLDSDISNQVTVAKIDATRFFKSANHFEIKAYPTIKFINQGKMIDYYGERRKNDLIEFVSRAESPRVTRTTSKADFDSVQQKRRHLFLLVSSGKEDESRLGREFYELANVYFLNAYFYHVNPEHLSTELQSSTGSGSGEITVSVFKEGAIEKYESENHGSLTDFLRNERFLTFSEMTMSNFHNLVETRKTLLILNLNSKDKQKAKQTKKLMEIYEKFSKSNTKINHKDFQFGYVDDSDLLNGIAIWTLPTPILFIFNTSSYQYAIQELISTETKTKAILDLDIQDLLDDIKLGKIEFYGGQTYFRQLRRPFWEIYRAVIEMFYEAPFLSLLIFGFPFGVISIVFYFLCCVDSNEQSDEDYLSNSDSEQEINEEDYYLEDEAACNEINSEKNKKTK